MRRDVPRAGDKALIVGARGWPQYNGTICRCITDPVRSKFRCLRTGIVQVDTCCRCELHDGQVLWIPIAHLIRIPPDEEAKHLFDSQGRENTSPKVREAA